LHIAAAAHHRRLLEVFLTLGADVDARNRRGAAPLHYAADGGPGLESWNPRAQVSVIKRLLKAGADVDAVDDSGVTPLHRAVRNRCAAAVEALLEGGADAKKPNKSGSTALDLARLTTGKSGSGTDAAKEQQQRILTLLS
jgi:ankyrin repeat protein